MTCSRSASRLQLGYDPHIVPKMWSLAEQLPAFLMFVDCCVVISHWVFNWNLLFLKREFDQIELSFVCPKMDVVVNKSICFKFLSADDNYES